MASCGPGDLLKAIDDAIDEATDKVGNAISDINEGIANAIDDITGAINEGLDKITGGVDGMLPQLPEVDLTLAVEAAALFSLRDNPVAFAAAAIALAEKYGLVDIDDITGKMLSGTFDPCKDIPNKIAKPDGTVVTKGAPASTAEKDAEDNIPLPIPPKVNIQPKATKQTTFIESKNTTQQALTDDNPAQSDPATKPASEIVIPKTIEHLDPLYKRTVVWVDFRGTGEYYPASGKDEVAARKMPSQQKERATEITLEYAQTWKQHQRNIIATLTQISAGLLDAADANLGTAEAIETLKASQETLASQTNAASQAQAAELKKRIEALEQRLANSNTQDGASKAEAAASLFETERSRVINMSVWDAKPAGAFTKTTWGEDIWGPKPLTVFERAALIPNVRVDDVTGKIMGYNVAAGRRKLFATIEEAEAFTKLSKAEAEAL